LLYFAIEFCAALMAAPPLFVLDLGFVPGPLKLCILSVLAPYCGRVEIVTECIG